MNAGVIRAAFWTDIGHGSDRDEPLLLPKAQLCKAAASVGGQISK